MRKYIVLILTLILSSYLALSQDMRYKELIEMIKKGNEKEAYSVLFDFQKKNPDFANTYFHLGNIAYKWTKNSDPLVDYEDTKYHIFNTKLFYGLGIAMLEKQPREVKRNNNFYRTITEFEGIKKLENQMVIDYMNKQYKSIEEYDNKTAEIVRYFHGLIKSYSKTKACFLNFITKNENINSLLVQPTEATMQTTDKIIALYDSTLYFYEQYKTALVNYPIKDYKQKLIEKPIKTYRLQGLVGTNFLTDTISIWNYKSWAKNIQKEIKTNINHFRKTITKSNNIISKKDEELSNLKKSSNSYRTLYVDQIVGFEVEKYDYNSIISSLFKYRKAKVNYLIQYIKSYNDRRDTIIDPTARAIDYYKLFVMKHKLDTLLLGLNAKSDSFNYMKHKDFFDKNYGGLEGLNSFINNQKTDNNKRSKQALSNFNYFVYRDIFEQSEKKRLVKYKDKEIPTYVSIIEPENAKSGNYYTVSKSSFNDEDYITGYYATDKYCQPFVAKIVGTTVEWLKLMKTPRNTISFGAKISAQETGCLLIIHSVDGNLLHKNTITQFLSNGKEMYKKEIDNNAMPRFLLFDDINSDVFIACQGLKMDALSKSNDKSLYLSKIVMPSGKELITKHLTLDGNITNILKINSDYYLFANFKEMSYEKSKLNSETGSIGLLKFTEQGEFVKLLKIEAKKNVWLNYALKVNDKTISLVAMTAKANVYKTAFKNLPQMYNIIINPDGKILYENY